MSFLRDRPWLWIILAFLIMILAWSVLLKVAIENRPDEVEIQNLPSHAQP